ncbi:MAG: hypothetical protein LBM77_03065 [Spirochaetaceae bacterium]|jgi:hypothetical protein|nr:hypothetical protein [Spirochaetaceae bacterium]MDR0908725.1 hypothetical protein [Spirochaetaceae bacterium]
MNDVMTMEDRRLLVENLAEMRELRGELSEFKAHVMGRVVKLEQRDGERARTLISMVSLAVSIMALVVSILVNFLV